MIKWTEIQDSTQNCLLRTIPNFMRLCLLSTVYLLFVLVIIIIIIIMYGSCRNGLFTEMMNSECMLDRDYQGWVDFGRRDAE